MLRDETGNTHPFRTAGTERARYAKLGEMAYLDEYRAKAGDVIRRDPAAYLIRVKNRLLAATLFYFPFSNLEGKRVRWVRSLTWSLPFIGLGWSC